MWTEGVRRTKLLRTLSKVSLGLTFISIKGADSLCEDLRKVVYACKALRELKLHWTHGREDVSIHYYQYLIGYADAARLAA